MHLPQSVGEIEITADWRTWSALLLPVLPIEIWLGLREDDAQSFVDFHRGWDTNAAPQKHGIRLSVGERVCNLL